PLDAPVMTATRFGNSIPTPKLRRRRQSRCGPHAACRHCPRHPLATLAKRFARCKSDSLPRRGILLLSLLACFGVLGAFARKGAKYAKARQERLWQSDSSPARMVGASEPLSRGTLL